MFPRIPFYEPAQKGGRTGGQTRQQLSQAEIKPGSADIYVAWHANHYTEVGTHEQTIEYITGNLFFLFLVCVSHSVGGLFFSS